MLWHYALLARDPRIVKKIQTASCSLFEYLPALHQANNSKHLLSVRFEAKIVRK